MIDLQLESGGKGRLFARRRVWWMLAVLLVVLPGLVVGEVAKSKKKPATHVATASHSKKSAAKRGVGKTSARPGGHAVASHLKGRAVVRHGKRGASRSVAPVHSKSVSYTHLRAHETGRNLVCR